MKAVNAPACGEGRDSSRPAGGRARGVGLKGMGWSGGHSTLTGRLTYLREVLLSDVAVGRHAHDGIELVAEAPACAIAPGQAGHAQQRPVDRDPPAYPRVGGAGGGRGGGGVDVARSVPLNVAWGVERV